MANHKLYTYIIAGHLMINVSAFILCFGLPVFVFYLIENIIHSITLVVLSFIAGITISWLLWSVLITKWRLWAFNQVEEYNLVKLKELAILNKLIWEDGNGFELTEIRKPGEDMEIKKVAANILELEQIGEIKLDLKTPETISYKFNKLENITETLSKLLVAIVAIGLLFTNVYLLSLILLAIIIFYGDGYKHIQHIFNNRDYLIVSNEGIQIEFPKSLFIGWEEIERIEINKEDKKMIIIKNSQEKIVCELWRFKISNLNLFVKQMKVFVDRYTYKQRC